ncbi:SPOR domain-containing protein, partial [Thermodesulfobacteriota bacterium]
RETTGTASDPVSSDAPSQAHTMVREEEGPEKETTPTWTIQVGAMVDKNFAQDMVDKLREMGYPAYVALLKRGNGKTLHRVRVGHFKNLGMARKAQKDLQQHRQPAIIVPE